MNEDDAALEPEACEGHMRRAIELARRGEGWTNPNPLVGAVLVKEGRVIGEGFHERYGQPHAERNALADCERRGEDPRGATLFVTLEPCCHTGKQPPCTEAVVQAGVSRVVVGSRDPNPLVGGKGNAFLRAAGIPVVEDFLRAECDELNPVFFHYIRTGLPYVVAKWAMTIDGKIATKSGDSGWISNELSRADVHEMRHRLAAVMVGSGTVAADDPRLTVRRSSGAPGNQSLRVVVDSQLGLSLDCGLVKTARACPVLVATAVPDDCERATRLRDAGVDVLSLPDGAGRVDLRALMRELGARGVDSVLVEGGGTIHASLFEAGLVNELVVYIAPKVVGGAEAVTPVEGQGVNTMAEAIALGSPVVERFGDDIKLTYRLGAEGSLAGADENAGVKTGAATGAGASASANSSANASTGAGEPAARENGGEPSCSPA